MPKMLSVQEYADYTGYHPATVRLWIKKGLLDGTERVPSRRCKEGYEHRIPMDANPPKPVFGRPRMKNGEKEVAWAPVQAEEPGQPLRHVKRSKREISMYIRKHADNQSYAAIARELGITTLEVREVYEKLHKRYHI